MSDYNDQVKEDEIGKTSSKEEGEEECIQDFCGETRRKEAIRKTWT
jgi:hypothetical protein